MDKKVLSRATILKGQIDRLYFDIDNLKKMLNDMSQENQRVEVTLRCYTRPWPFFSMRNRVPGGKHSLDFNLIQECVQLILTNKEEQLRDLEMKLEHL